MPRRDILLAILVAVVWGCNFVAIRWGVDEVAPLLLSALRYLFAAVPAVFLVRPPKVRLSLLVGYGFAIGVGQFGLLYAAIGLGMPAGLASLVAQLQAFFSIGLAAVMLGERPSRAQLAGAAVAFLGIATIASERLAGTTLIPLLMTVAAALSWAFGNVITKRAGRVDMLAFVVWSSLVPPIPLYLLSLVLEGPEALPEALGALTWLGAGSLVYMAYVSTLVGYGLWSALLARHPSNLVTPFSLLVPVVGIAGGALLLGETVTPIEMAGSALVFAGLVLAVLRRSRAAPRAAPAGPAG